MSTDLAPMPRGVRRRARTRAALVEAARTVFAERGVEAPTIQEITDAADVAKGSFYNHFESREDLQRAVVEAALEELGSALDRDVAKRERDPARVIAASLLSTIRTAVADPALGGFLLQHPDSVDAGEPIATRGRRDVRRGQRSGRFQVDDLDATLAALSGAALGVVRGRLRGGLDAAAEPRCVAMALRMLGVAPDEARDLADEAASALDERTT